MIFSKRLLPFFLSFLSFTLLPVLQPVSGAAGLSLINRFSHIYEPSGVLRLSGGDLLVIEDDGHNPLHLIPVIDGSSAFLGQPVSLPLSTSVGDLEGISSGRDGTVFLITSFSPTRKNKRKKKRQRLIQFQIENGRIVNELHYDNLLPYLTRHLAKEKSVGTKGADTLNIEGIALDKENDSLLIGFRSPLEKNKAVIIVLENPYDLFSTSASPVFSPRNILLDIGGEGIRGMGYDDIEGGYLITNEVKNRKGNLRPALWFWKGDPSSKSAGIPLPKLKGVKNIEGITPITIGSRHFLFLVCDDGARKKKKGAHYILLER